MAGLYASCDGGQDMQLRRSLGWVVAALATVAGVIALAVALGQWHAYSLDEQGRALVAEGEYLPAVRVLVQAVAQAPGDARAHYYLGLAYAGIGLCGAAWTHLEEAARLAPAYGRLRPGPGLACRGSVLEPDVRGQFDHAVHRDRQGGALI
jgi:tetratricopeptide (TPR) repeat protein